VIRQNYFTSNYMRKMLNISPNYKTIIIYNTAYERAKPFNGYQSIKLCEEL